MNNLEVFNFENEEVRSLLINGEPWFVGKDVADILKYKNGSRDINRHVDEEDRKKAMIFDGNQNKETIIINESGLYSLILYSKMPSAKKFKRFITSEVIPSLRKHGMYATEETIDKILLNPDFFLHCEAFQWCRGKEEIEEEYEEHEENLKQFAIFYGIVFVIMIIIMVVLNNTMGIVWD